MVRGFGDGGEVVVVVVMGVVGVVGERVTLVVAVVLLLLVVDVTVSVVGFERELDVRYAEDDGGAGRRMTVLDDGRDMSLCCNGVGHSVMTDVSWDDECVLCAVRKKKKGERLKVGVCEFEKWVILNVVTGSWRSDSGCDTTM